MNKFSDDAAKSVSDEKLVEVGLVYYDVFVNFHIFTKKHIFVLSR